jgi:hypothetical protein
VGFFYAGCQVSAMWDMCLVFSASKKLLLSLCLVFLLCMLNVVVSLMYDLMQHVLIQVLCAGSLSAMLVCFLFFFCILVRFGTLLPIRFLI